MGLFSRKFVFKEAEEKEEVAATTANMHNNISNNKKIKGESTMLLLHLFLFAFCN